MRISPSIWRTDNGFLVFFSSPFFFCYSIDFDIAETYEINSSRTRDSGKGGNGCARHPRRKECADKRLAKGVKGGGLRVDKGEIE